MKIVDHKGRRYYVYDGGGIEVEYRIRGTLAWRTVPKNGATARKIRKLAEKVAPYGDPVMTKAMEGAYDWKERH